jgi:hypothetical protein
MYIMALGKRVRFIPQSAEEVLALTTSVEDLKKIRYEKPTAEPQIAGLTLPFIF